MRKSPRIETCPQWTGSPMLGEGATSAGPFAGKPINHLAGRLGALPPRFVAYRTDMMPNYVWPGARRSLHWQGQRNTSLASCRPYRSIFHRSECLH
jgi:hypothetical protein